MAFSDVVFSGSTTRNQTETFNKSSFHKTFNKSHHTQP